MRSPPRKRRAPYKSRLFLMIRFQTRRTFVLLVRDESVKSIVIYAFFKCLQRHGAVFAFLCDVPESAKQMPYLSLLLSFAFFQGANRKLVAEYAKRTRITFPRRMRSRAYGTFASEFNRVQPPCHIFLRNT